MATFSHTIYRGRGVCVPVLVVSALCGAPAQKPDFREYPVRDVFRGTPSFPRIVTDLERQYADHIIAGVEKGYGVYRDGKPWNAPNFAGHYFAIRWGCGTTCVRMAIVDATSGRIYRPPTTSPEFHTKGFDLPVFVRPGYDSARNPNVLFSLNSTLMIVDATPRYDRRRPSSYRYYFLWSHNRWRLLYRFRLR